MKKIVSILLAMVVLVSLCACAKQEPAPTTVPTESSVTEPIVKDEIKMSPEELYGHIDQTVPQDGVYKLWNTEGVKLIAQHPDATFEILCNIDLEGATLAPVPEFTGKIIGGYFTLKNFTVQGGSEESFGFIGVNKGSIDNLYFDAVTMIPGTSAKYIGMLAGVNEGSIKRGIITAATMEVTQAPEGAVCGGIVGHNVGSLANLTATVDVIYSAPGSATIGGIVGTAKGGTIEYTENHGALTVTGENKTVGLLAGEITDVVLTECVFGGADNSLNGKLFINMTGNPDDDELVTTPNALYRVNDYHTPLPEAQQKLRDRVVEEMNTMGLVEWRLRNDLIHTCTCALAECNGVYNDSTLYIGIPYNHKGSSMERMRYVLDEDGYIKDWLYGLEPYDGFDLYMGNDCSTAVAHAWWTVSNSVDFYRVTYMIPQNAALCHVGTGREDSGIIPVGDYEYTMSMTKGYTIYAVEATGEQRMCKAYASMRKGDAYAYIGEPGGHTRMAAEDPVVFYNQAGEIDPNYSYILSSEQGGARNIETPSGETIHTAWRVRYKFTFANLLEKGFVPVTCEELLTGEMEPATCELQNGADGYAGMYDGLVKANYFLDSVDLEIKDSTGKTVFFHTMWTTVDKRHDIGENDGLLRNYKDYFDLVAFATPLSKTQFEVGETYSYSLTAHLHTYEDFVVKEDSFTYGAA